MHQRSPLAAQLGATAAEPGPMLVDALEVDPGFHTTAEGVSAAGDIAPKMPSVATAVAAGSAAAAMLVHDLMGV
jgi:thioredoxin reductase